MESHLSLNPLQANLQDLTQAATNLQADLATSHSIAMAITFWIVDSINNVEGCFQEWFYVGR